MSIIRPANTVILLIILAALLVPGVTAAAITQFEDPLGGASGNPKAAIEAIITKLIVFLLGLSAAVAFVALVYGGLRLVLGSAIGEAEVARAKQIVFWAIAGLAVIGMAAMIIVALRTILGI